MTRLKHRRIGQGCVPGPSGETAKEFSGLASSKLRFIQWFTEIILRFAKLTTGQNCFSHFWILYLVVAFMLLKGGVCVDSYMPWEAGQKKSHCLRVDAPLSYKTGTSKALRRTNAFVLLIFLLTFKVQAVDVQSILTPALAPAATHKIHPNLRGCLQWFIPLRGRFMQKSYAVSFTSCLSILKCSSFAHRFLKWGEISPTVFCFCGAPCLPLGAAHQDVLGNSLTPEQKFCASLIVVVSDTSVTLSQKIHTANCTGEQNYKPVAYNFSFWKLTFWPFLEAAVFLWVTWPLLLENWC